MHSAGLRYSKVNGNPRIRPFGQRQVFPGRLSCEHLMLGLHQDKRRSGNEADYPRACRWHIAGCSKGRSRARPGSVPNASARFGAGIIIRFCARPPRRPGRGCRDLRLRSPCPASPGRPPRTGRAIPRTSPLAETRSWTPPAAHPRSAAAETCPGAPESWVPEDYHEPTVFSYGWRPFSPASCRYRRS